MTNTPMRLQEPLTKKQSEVLNYILKMTHERDYVPSHREIADALGVSSPATIHEHVTRLREKGYLKDTEETASPAAATRTLQAKTHAVLLPLMGLITAGEPIEGVEDKTETIAVPASFVIDGANSFVLKVKGQSMIDDGILDGDYVVIEHNPSPKNGEIIVALLDNAYATLKRFYRERDRIRLQPANKTMKPIYVQPSTMRCQGVVRAVIRKFQPA